MSVSDPLTCRIIGAAYLVYNKLGSGHLEHVYRNALAAVLKREGFRVQIESRLDVIFEGEMIGWCEADLVVNGFTVETKAQEAILPGHKRRLRAYLRSCGKNSGLILNFGPVRVEVKRVEADVEEEVAG